jgi:hypothetical protein
MTTMFAQWIPAILLLDVFSLKFPDVSLEIPPEMELAIAPISTPALRARATPLL